MKIDVLILYEHVQRELKYACILKVLLEREGFIVKIDKYMWRKGLLNLKYKPKLIICPSCQSDIGMNYIIHNYVGAYDGGYKILNLYSEQLGDQSTNEILIIKESALNIYHIAWGEYRYKISVEMGLTPEQIRITGSQRLDFAKGIFRRLNATKSELSQKFNLDIDKKWILAIGNYSNKDEFDFEYYERIGCVNFKELHDLTKDTYYETIKWYEKLINCKYFKEQVEFIYRPHPSEIVTNELLNIQKNNLNFHIISDLSISDWAINSDMVCIWTSTSSVEVAATKVPIVSVVPIEIKDCYKIHLVNCIEQVKTYEELLDYSKDIILNGNREYNKEFRAKVGYYYLDSNVSASENIVKFSKDILNNGNRIIKSNYNYFKAFLKTIIYIYEFILYRLNLGIKNYLKIRFRDYR